MKRSLMLLAVGVGVLALTMSLAASPALALSFTGSYYTLSSTHPDTGKGVDGQTITGLVNPALSGGLPVYTGVVPPVLGPPAAGGGSGAITDVDGGNRIQWWTANGVVSVDNSVNGGINNLRSDPFAGGVLGGGAFASSFFPAGNATDGAGYRSVHWTGSFTVVGSVVLRLSADDDAWLFLDNNLRLDNGGVKGIGDATTSATVLGPGTYSADLLFADRHQSQAGIVFSCSDNPEVQGQGECLTAIPEPATLLLFGTTIAGLGAVIRRRMKGQKEVA